MGVDVFFAISGFLITTLLLQEHRASGGISLRRFYGARFIRLAPGLVLLTLIITTAMYLTGTAGRAYPQMAAGALLYLTPFTRHFVGGDPIFDHTWSLGLEEYFYLCWPLIILISQSRLMRTRLLFILTGLVTLTSYGLYEIELLRGQENGNLRVAGIALGCLYALWARGHGHTARPAIWAWLGLIGIGSAVLLGQMPRAGGFAAAIAAASTIAFIHGLLSHQNTIPARILACRPLVFIGVISYEVYLWHAPIITLAHRVLDLPVQQWGWLWALLSVVVALAANRSLRPLQKRLRVRLSPKAS